MSPGFKTASLAAAAALLFAPADPLRAQGHAAHPAPVHTHPAPAAPGQAPALGQAPAPGQVPAPVRGAVPDGPVTDDHAGHPGATSPREPIPPVTAADRAAAFPEVAGHTVHDQAVHTFLLFDRLEWRDADGGGALDWDVNGWLGRDTERLWLRAEGEREGGRTEHAEAHLLYGRAFAPWWAVVAGVRQDFRPGPAQTWAALGVQGLAPYGFEVEAGVYLGEAGRTAARVEVEYELLLTNRLILQPRVELNAYGRDDERRDVDAGLSEVEAGLRLRYELRREFAPYVGVTWGRRSGSSAAGEGDVRLVVGARFWF